MDLYFEMNSGIAGDMTIAALLDLGASKEKLVKAIESMGIDGYELVFDRKIKNNIDANNFDVILSNHDHDHHHDHDHDHNHDHTHEHVDENGNTYTHSHSDDHHGHRHLKEITDLINKADISQRAKKDALGIFEIIADAEAKAHGIEKSAVHFHEVGAVDSIIDIIGTAVLIDDLGVENIYFSDLSEGYGYQYSSHGQMPIPVPAVINILAGSDINLKLLDEEGEHVTPTGAAIVRYYDKGEKINSFKVKNVGLGAGNKDFAKYTNILRVMEIESSKKKH
ncbi:LarC family nickel insertion protein [Anaerococcus martiniensis]|uniref:LarC family nickel insertion protein n=1 Tax=Anaerococcus sp. WGS1579 TaxID=3366809 RepID=UPI00372CF7A4